MNIYCVIVTFNRLDLLKNTINRVCDQTLKVSGIIVVNNASNDGTKEFLDKLILPLHLIIINESKNLGGAAGFKVGIDAAYKQGCDWIWVMDDDSSPVENALELLVRPLDSTLKDVDVGFLASRVVWKDGSICYMNTPVVDRDWPEYSFNDPLLIRLWSASFVSVLINRNAVKKVGLPVSEFFIWYDDCEYTSRISLSFKNFYVSDSVVYHLTPENIRPMDFSKINKNNVWKFCYGVRNESACLTNRHTFGFFRSIFLSLRLFTVCFVFSKSLSISFKILISGLKGMFFRYKSLIDFPEECI